jgi:DNA-binding HxlR family transcriptional regulator
MAVKVLAEAAPGEVRFAELKRRMPGVSRKMLSTTLRSLLADGLAERRVEDTVPPHVHCRLTDLGLSLGAALAVVREWAEAHMPEIDRNRGLNGVPRGNREIVSQLCRTRHCAGSPARKHPETRSPGCPFPPHPQR